MQAFSFTRLFLVLFALLAVATAGGSPSGTTSSTPSSTPTSTPSQCDTGSLQCCDSTQEASSLSGTLETLLELLGINVSSLTGEVGVTCSPISVIGVGGDDCDASPVCCENNSFNGVVAIGCSPISI